MNEENEGEDIDGVLPANKKNIPGERPCSPGMFQVGTRGLEPPRRKAHDPKSCASASSATSPRRLDYNTTPGEDQRAIAGRGSQGCAAALQFLRPLLRCMEYAEDNHGLTLCVYRVGDDVWRGTDDKLASVVYPPGRPSPGWSTSSFTFCRIVSRTCKAACRSRASKNRKAAIRSSLA